MKRAIALLFKKDRVINSNFSSIVGSRQNMLIISISPDELSLLKSSSKEGPDRALQLPSFWHVNVSSQPICLNPSWQTNSAFSPGTKTLLSRPACHFNMAPADVGFGFVQFFDVDCKVKAERSPRWRLSVISIDKHIKSWVAVSNIDCIAIEKGSKQFSFTFQAVSSDSDFVAWQELTCRSRYKQRRNSLCQFFLFFFFFVLFVCTNELLPKLCTPLVAV